MKKLLTLFFCLFSLTVAAQDDATADSCLVVWHKDGSQLKFSLGESPKITYVGDSVVVETAAGAVTYAFQAIRKMTVLLEDTTTGIAAATADDGGERPFAGSGRSVTFQPDRRDLHVSIVLPSGVVVSRFVVRSHETKTLSLASLPAGVCLINVNGVTYKISVR
ncbi:MAG: hypothetical protein IJ637_00155 [Prevotella sp.]|nr:hypothetical protein [Prevotella sp.]